MERQSQCERGERVDEDVWADEKWAEVKKDLKQKQYGTKKVDGKNQQLKKKKGETKGKQKDAVVPSAEPPSEPKKLRRSSRNKNKKN